MKLLLFLALCLLCFNFSSCDNSDAPITYEVRLSATKGSVGTTNFVRIYYKVGEITMTINNSTTNFAYVQSIQPNTRIDFTVAANINNAPSQPTASSSLKVIKLQGGKETEVCNVSRTNVEGALTNYGINHGIYETFNGTSCTPVSFEKQ